jgi:hypothetical protein
MMEQVFGRNAAVVHAGPADGVLLEQDRFFPELGAADGRRIAAGARPDDGDIFFHDRHGSSFRPRAQPRREKDKISDPRPFFNPKDRGARIV